MDCNQHVIGNILIKLDGLTAAVESYFYGIQRGKVKGVVRDTVASGRYLDRFERRQGEWRIKERIVVTDWFREYPDSADWTAGPFGMPDAPRGAFYPEDSSYTWLRLR
jgi:hypothetical protein